MKTPAALNKKLKSVKLFLCDVDGVLTDGTVYMGGGVEMKRFNIRDGLGIEIFAKARDQGWLGFPPSFERHATARG